MKTALAATAQKQFLARLLTSTGLGIGLLLGLAACLRHSDHLPPAEIQKIGSAPRQTPNATVRALATIVTSYKNLPTPTHDPVLAATVAAAMGSTILIIGEGEPDRGPAPLTVKFGLSDYEGIDIDEAKFLWDFGDGSPTSKERRPVHTYKTPGRYTASVQVMVGKDGDKSRVRITVLDPVTPNP